MNEIDDGHKRNAVDACIYNFRRKNGKVAIILTLVGNSIIVASQHILSKNERI